MSHLCLLSCEENSPLLLVWRRERRLGTVGSRLRVSKSNFAEPREEALVQVPPLPLCSCLRTRRNKDGADYVAVDGAVDGLTRGRC